MIARSLPKTDNVIQVLRHSEKSLCKPRWCCIFLVNLVKVAKISNMLHHLFITPRFDTFFIVRLLICPGNIDINFSVLWFLWLFLTFTYMLLFIWFLSCLLCCFYITYISLSGWTGDWRTTVQTCCSFKSDFYWKCWNRAENYENLCGHHEKSYNGTWWEICTHNIFRLWSNKCSESNLNGQFSYSRWGQYIFHHL